LTAPEVAVLGEAVRGSLATLKDVAGIAGSFVCTQSGRLIAREIPAMFEDAVLAEAGSRLVRIGETFAASGDELEFAVARYGENRLFLKAISGGMLCIVVAGDVNMPALKMAANLVGRRISAAVARAQAELPPATLEAPTPRAAAPRTAGETGAAAPVPVPDPRPGSGVGAAAAAAVPGRRFRGRSAD
jgi:predicted regulator of Ras-like GTPase activity (Roadblock/LC7/MglB family)